MKRILALLLTAASLPALAANVSGKWAIQDNSAGAPRRPVVLILNQAGDAITGTLAVPAEAWTNSPVNTGIFGAKAEGNTISFYVWTGMDQPAKASYRGIVSASGEEIVFTVTGAGAPKQVAARRVQ